MAVMFPCCRHGLTYGTCKGLCWPTHPKVIVPLAKWRADWDRAKREHAKKQSNEHAKKQSTAVGSSTDIGAAGRRQRGPDKS